MSRRCLRSTLFVLVSLCPALIAGMPHTVRAADVDLPTYVQRLTAARDALAQAQGQIGAQRDAAVQRAQDALVGIDGVTVDGVRYPEQQQAVLDALRRSPPDIERAVAQVNLLRATLMDEQATQPDPQARTKLDRVLSDRAFREAEPNAVQRQAFRFRSWVGEQLGKLLRPFRRVRSPEAPASTPGAGSLASLLALLGDPLTLIVFAALAILIVLIIWLRRRQRRARRRAEPAFRERTAAEWRQYAAARAAEHDYRAAVRALYLGTITELDERRIIPFDPALTDREYLWEAQRQQGWLVEPLRPFVRLIEAIVYAAAPCRAAEYERARELADAVLARVAMPEGFAA